MLPMLGIEDFLLAAESVLGIDPDRLMRVTKIPLAESALAAPFASFGGHEFYKHPLQRAAVLASRIMRNHPLPDGNKRVALLLMDIYLEQHGYRLTATPQDIDRTFRAVASKQMTEDYFLIWLKSRTEPLS
jgi:death-on-curing protein